MKTLHPKYDDTVIYVPMDMIRDIDHALDNIDKACHILENVEKGKKFPDCPETNRDTPEDKEQKI